MNQKVQLNRSQIEMLNTGTMMNDGSDVRFYHLPMWFKSTENDNVFEMIFPKDLPKWVLEFEGDTKIILEVNGGVLGNVIADKPIQYVLVDWDNIKQGDEFPTMEDSMQADIIVDNIEKTLTALRIDNILKDNEDENNN